MIAAEQVGEDEPGGAGAPADRAVRDQLILAVEVDGGEDAAQVSEGPERPALVVQTVDGLVDRRGDMAGLAARLHAAGGPESLPSVLVPGAHINQGAAVSADRVAHRRVAGPEPTVLPGQDIRGGRGRGRLPAHRVARIPPGVSRAIEDAHVVVAVELHQPEAHGGRIAVAHDGGVRADAGKGQEPFGRRGTDEPVINVLQVTVDVPEHGSVDMPFVVGAAAHVDLDHPHRGVVQVLGQPSSVDENAITGGSLTRWFIQRLHCVSFTVPTY